MPAAHNYPQSHWNPARDAAFRPLWLDGIGVDEICAALNTIPGPRPIAGRLTLSKRAEKFGLKRPAWYLAQVRRHVSAAGNAAQAVKLKPLVPRSHHAAKVPMRVTAGSPWPAGDPKLRALWADGLSTAAIGRAIGVGKGAVVGRAHRIGCPERPGAIHHGGVPRVARAGAVTLPGLRVVSDRAPVVVVLSAKRTCQWIDVRHGPMCGEKAVLGRSWCINHCAILFSNWEQLRARVVA